MASRIARLGSGGWSACCRQQLQHLLTRDKSCLLRKDVGQVSEDVPENPDGKVPSGLRTTPAPEGKADAAAEAARKHATLTIVILAWTVVGLLAVIAMLVSCIACGR